MLVEVFFINVRVLEFTKHGLNSSWCGELMENFLLEQP